MPDTSAPDTSRGRVALVTGATGPIGRAVAAELASSGFRVVITGRNAEALAGLSGELARTRGGPPMSVAADLTDEEAVTRLVETVTRELGGVDVLVNSAGGWVGARPGPFLEKSRADLRAQVENNLLLPVLLSHAVLGGMVQRGYGRIVAISSVAGLIGLAGHGAYSAAKAGLSGFVRQLAYEFGRSGVTANCLAPGPVATPNVRRLVEAGDPGLLAMLEQTPSGRLTTPEDIARAVAFLGSEAAGHINGQTIAVDGGMTAA